MLYCETRQCRAWNQWLEVRKGKVQERSYYDSISERVMELSAESKWRYDASELLVHCTQSVFTSVLNEMVSTGVDK